MEICEPKILAALFGREKIFQCVDFIVIIIYNVTVFENFVISLSLQCEEGFPNSLPSSSLLFCVFTEKISITDGRRQGC